MALIVSCLTNEQLWYGEEGLRKIVLNLFNEISEKQIIPDDWNKSDIILIFKKGKKNLIKNYIPITLFSTLAKVFSFVIRNRIKGMVDSQQPCEQTVLRSGYSSIDHLQAVNQILKKVKSTKLTFSMAFEDFSKVFDSVEHSFMIQAMVNQGILIEFVKFVIKLYENAHIRIVTNFEKEYFKIINNII